MKTTCIVFALLASTLVGVQAQVTGTGATATISQPALPAPTAFSPVSRDGTSIVWERTVYERGPNGTVMPRKSRYTELSSGLNFLQNGQWKPSSEKIDLLPPGGAFAAAATHGQHSARFPLDIAQGVISLTTPEGKQLTSRPVGLFFEDDSNSVLIAILTNSVGGLVGSNEVVYPDAFEGASASLHYKYTRAGFEQDVVVQGRLPDPGTLGLNPARTRLGVLTAFFDTNNPVATTGPTDPADGLSDATLTFGVMKMGPGRAFSIGNTGQSPSSFGGTPTYKRWFQLNGHNFLMEEVPYQRVAAQLEQLPAATGRAGIIATNLFAANSILNGVSAGPLPPAQLSKSGIGNGNPKMARLAGTGWDQTRALVLDYYVTVNSGSSRTFQGDTTYYISGTVNLGSSTFEGGAVLKYDTGAALMLYSPPVWLADAYHPVIFTAKDDNTVGETVSTGNLIGYYAGGALVFLSPPTTISNFRISYAQDAIVLFYHSGAVCPVFNDGQLVNCQNGFYRVFMDSGNIAIRNMLFANVQAGFNAVWNSTVDAQNTTFSGCGVLTTYLGYGGLSLENCILANVAAWAYYIDPSAYLSGANNGFYNSQPFGTSVFTTQSNPFQTARGGHYYLADNTFRGKGTSGVSPSLLADLATKTTHPPDTSHVNQPISSDTTLSSRGFANIGPPDLGYHYPILDYIVSQTVVGANLTLDPGTVVGWQGQGLSFSAPYVTVSFNGTVNRPCYFVRCNTVQEADVSVDGTGIAGSSQYPEIKATFTRFSALGDLAAFFDGNWVLADSIYNCEFWSGLIGGNAIDVLYLGCYNCLFDRCFINFSMAAGSVYGLLNLQNCTLHGGKLKLQNPNNSMNANVRDSAFDGTTIDGSGNYSFFYNAYLSGANNPFPDQHDVTVSGSFNWQSGPRGNYYLPNDPPAQDGRLLIDAGDQQASQINVIMDGATGAQEPLSSFTTQTSQTLDSGLVDIGYHCGYFPPVVAGPQLTAQCNPYLSGEGVGVLLTWSITDIEQKFLYIADFKIYRSTVSGGPYGNPIASVDGSKRYYWDNTAVNGQTYYYVVTFDYQVAGTTRESPYSNQIVATAHYSGVFLTTDAYWDVTDVTHANHIGLLQAPFGLPLDYDTKYPTQPPLVPVSRNSQDLYWSDCNTWECHYPLLLPANWTTEQLAQVKFSFAVDNSIAVFVNSQELTYPDPSADYSIAHWSLPFRSLPHLVPGANDIKVVISGDCDAKDYFSMVVTTNDCGLSGP